MNLDLKLKVSNVYNGVTQRIFRLLGQTHRYQSLSKCEVCDGSWGLDCNNRCMFSPHFHRDSIYLFSYGFPYGLQFCSAEIVLNWFRKMLHNPLQAFISSGVGILLACIGNKWLCTVLVREGIVDFCSSLQTSPGLSDAGQLHCSIQLDSSNKPNISNSGNWPVDATLL